jgi:hypothetical protein
MITPPLLLKSEGSKIKAASAKPSDFAANAGFVALAAFRLLRL